MGISIWQLAIIAVVVILLFGTKKLRNMGKDLGGAVKDFKGAIKEEENKVEEPKAQNAEPQKIEAAKADANFAELSEKEKNKTE